VSEQYDEDRKGPVRAEDYSVTDMYNIVHPPNRPYFPSEFEDRNRHATYMTNVRKEHYDGDRRNGLY
jgi:hypothetical protein